MEPTLELDCSGTRQWGASGKTYIVGEELQDKCGHTSIDANEEIHTGQHNICRARDFEHKGGWIHKRGDGPPGERKGSNIRQESFQSKSLPSYPLIRNPLPIQKQKESQHRQVGGGYIGLLLEADEDDDN